MSALICGMLLAVAAAGQAEPQASVALDARALGLDAVRDREELLFEDREAYFRILAHLQDVDAEALDQAAAGFRHQRWSTVKEYGDVPEDEFPVFVDLFLHPSDYRGQPVTLRGHLVGPIVTLPDGAEYGLDRLYQTHLFDNDSQTNPTTVIFTDLPPGVDREAELIDGVSVTGYFFKVHWYRSRSGQRQLAPLILARTIDVRPPAPPEWPVSTGGAIAVILALAVVALLVVVMVRRRDRGAINDYRRRFEAEPRFDPSEIETSAD